jgi:hypothetical protein
MNAQELEKAFLAGLEDAQAAYEQIVETQAWTELGFDTFAGWWDQRVQPTMRALSMRPTREIAAAVIEQVRQEEADLPPVQRRTQQELADMVGVDRRTAVGWRPPQDRSDVQDVRGDDLERSPVVEAMTEAIQEVAEAPRPKASERPVWSAEENALLYQVRRGETVVVSMRGRYENLIRWAESEGKYVRIDRRTEWGNPFEMPADGDRETVIAAYAEHYLPHKPSLLEKLPTLRGKVLGCWCAPDRCHGDILRTRARP